MRVLIYSHSFLPRVGGVEVYTDRLARYLAGEGVEAVVATRTGASEASGSSERRYEVVRGPTAADLDSLVARCDLLQCNGFHLAALRSARKHGVPALWFHHDYDLICPKSIAWNGSVSCRFSSGPCIVCLARDHSMRAVATRIAGYAARRACLNWAQVHAVHTEYARRRMGLAGAVILRCAADLSEQSALGAGSTADRRPPTEDGGNSGELGGPQGNSGGLGGTRGDSGELGDSGLRTQDSGPRTQDPPLSTQHAARSTQHGFLLFAGRLIPEKGCEVLISALARCHRWGLPLRLEVCGDGRERASLEALSDRLGLREAVRFRGDMSQRVLGDLMSGALATVVPSVWDEVTGAVALEAMGHGCPVIASEVGGLGEMVRGVGLLFPRGNVEELATRIAEVARDPGLARGLSRRSLAASRTVYDWRLVIRDYMAVYGGMVGAR